MKTIHRSLSWLVLLLVPFALTFVGLRLLLTRAFPEVEYRLPGFPADTYGFTLQDRLKWSEISIDYLVNGADISYLGNQVFSDGSPLYNPRELSHMQDVKNVIQPVLWIGYVVWFLLIGLAAWSRFGVWGSEFALGLRRGGWVTVGLVAVLGLLAAVSFWQFFTVFHELFFKGDSWLFLYSDTLIRLFPLPFWESAFLFAGLLDVACGLALGLGLRKSNRSRSGAQLRGFETER